MSDSRDLNPYASPQVADAAELPILPQERWNEIQVQLLSVRKGAMRRWLTIGGTCESEIFYDGLASGERVFVNQRVRGRGNPWGWSYVSPRIDFRIDAWQWQVPAWIEAQAGLSVLTFLRLKWFRLTIAGHVIYEE